MVHLIKKTIKGKKYLYLAASARVNGKPKRIWQKYLGPEEKFNEFTEFVLDRNPQVTTLDFGLPMALLQVVRQLRLIEIINECTGKRAQGLSVGHYVAIATINRCVKPTSKAKLRRWFEHTALSEEFPSFDTYLDSMAYRNHFEYLTPEIIETIETQINKRLISEFGVEMKTLFYDPTNFFTFLNPKDEQSLANHGHSKEGRHTLNLVGLSLFCTQDGGLPILHEVYPGNVQDAALFKEQVPRLLERCKDLGLTVNEICLVFDKGNISSQAFEQIRTAGLSYICSIRPSTQKEFESLTKTDFELKKLPNGKEIGVREFSRSFHGAEERLLVVYNPHMHAWQEKNLRRKLDKKITLLHDWFSTRLNQGKWRSAKAVEEKIRKILKNKKHRELVEYSAAGAFGQVTYEVKVKEAALQAHVASLGKSYFLSNHSTLPALELVWMYRQQYTVERAFKYLKSPEILSIRPMYHRKKESIRGHLFTCVLGLLLLTLLVRTIQREWKAMSFWDILEYLSELQLAIIHYQGTDKMIRKLVDITPKASQLSEFLALDRML